MRRAVLALVLLLAASCAGPVADYALTVHKDGRELARLDLAALTALPQTSVSTPGTGNGGVQTGPAIEAVLAAAAPYASVEVTGDEGTLRFTAAELRGAVLDVTNRGTVKLAGPDLPRERWVRNVTDLAVSSA